MLFLTFRCEGVEKIFSPAACRVVACRFGVKEPYRNFSSSRLGTCWTGDARISKDNTSKCTDYTSTLFKENSILQRPLYPPGFSEPPVHEEAMFVTNSVPKSLNHTTLEVKAFEMLENWAHERGPLHVLTGPAFDLDATGLKPSSETFQRMQLGPLSIPTHFFLVATWCSGEVESLGACDPQRLETSAFLLPNFPFTHNCESEEQTMWKNQARIVDIEKLTGLSLFTSLPAYQAVRLRTRVPDPIL
ncbi:venom phosphodiesterase 2 [Caerostris darwini]|uniref:Venom phosphodiesterase 2 n=1 Tax=Caerostris darwini TaxID=1538125 RepID=A0AAV4MSV3_9ARAC|nr:venom phosphodiesterase 2 [Caerostris darwini]